MLRRPCAVYIVCVLNSVNINEPQLNYRLFHSRNPNINRVGFGVLNAYEICGQSAINSRTLPHKAIGYILVATGEGRKGLCLNPRFPLSYINYVFIENHEDQGPGCFRIRFSRIHSICWFIVIADILRRG